MSPVKRSDPADAADEVGGPGDAPTAALAARLATDVAALDAELAEIDMLVAQARTEAARHEQKRAQTADKISAGAALPPEDLATLNAQLLTLTKRAAMMQSQVDVLEGKRKSLGRFRATLAELSASYGGLVPSPAADGLAAGEPAPRRLTAGGSSAPGEAPPSPMSRIVLNAQEDLRREIARAMHDGPAQSLTNIVLQAQILERLLGRDVEGARNELRLLIGMVQQTLEATKTFIFDVRPMVLDDLGLVPTLRRAARERGRRAGIPVECESIGQDHRLAVDLESSLFRIIDEALSAFLSARPDRVAIRLDWSDELVEASVGAARDATAAMTAADAGVADAIAAAAAGTDLPPALEAMMAERRRQAEGVAAAAREAAIVALPPTTWREIQQRATTTGIAADLADDGATLRLRVDLGLAANGAGDTA